MAHISKLGFGELLNAPTFDEERGTSDESIPHKRYCQVINECLLVLVPKAGPDKILVDVGLFVEDEVQEVKFNITEFWEKANAVKEADMLSWCRCGRGDDLTG